MPSATDNPYGPYVPDAIPSIATTVLFALLTAAHIWGTLVSRRFFGFVIAVGGICTYRKVFMVDILLIHGHVLLY